MNNLGNYTNPALILPELQNKTAAGAIAELCALLQRQRNLSDSKAFYDAVMTREQLSPTSFTPGWALPHARHKTVTRLSFTLGRSSQPFLWSNQDRVPTQLVFLFAVPEAETKAYLGLLAAVAKLNQNPVLLETLLRAPDRQSIFKLLSEDSVVTRAATAATATR